MHAIRFRMTDRNSLREKHQHKPKNVDFLKNFLFLHLMFNFDQFA